MPAQMRAARLAPVLLAFLPAAVPVRTVQACSLDGIASLSVNGPMASLTTGRPTASTLSQRCRWIGVCCGTNDDKHE